MNLKQYRARVSLNLGTPFMMANGIQPNNVDQAINEVYTRIAFNTKSVESQFTLTADGSESYPLDSQFMMIKQVLYDYDAETQYGLEVEEVARGFAMEDDDVSLEEDYEEAEMYYWLTSPHDREKGRIWFHPKPLTGKVILLLATVYPDFMVSDTDTPRLKQICDSLIINGATMDLGNIGEGIPNRIYYERQFVKDSEEARRLLSKSSSNRFSRVSYRETWQ
jgi:hypothetical protein